MDKMGFNFHMPTKLVFEDGAADSLSKHVKGTSLLMMCDPFLYKIGTAQKVAEATNIEKVVYFNEIEPNPSCQTVDKAAAMAREHNVDVVIGLGGGSAMDASKMVTCLIDNEGSIFDYYSTGNKELKPRKAQLICIPTTAGTGSEVTNIGVYTNKETGIKMPFASPYFWPDIALIDPMLTHTMPMHITASTGMDAFTHAIEAYWSVNSNPISDALSVSVIKTILENIETACKEPTNIEARKNMAFASVTAGISFSQTKTTGIHAVSFPLTTDFGASHGLACSITLPAFIKLAYTGRKEKMDALFTMIGYESLESFVGRVEEIMKNIEIPTRLSALNVKESDLDRIVEISMKAPLIHFTPVKMDEDVLYDLLKSIL
ncbi:iron-containing alcohol dehydrogenase [Bacillus sp. HMF5848]|uniref:iron-containing alcohol dehydrogenase n=1 Tax=Bacillus sp. HMF5848 TaxID=2495421 RepID=UPI000F76D00E|nr:iron-containing alcohol dehydrogenase [Bacillus sp. HMF5848]RSK25719.1 iron-containing alcohol dehydrogenase [Bacillus sp. HMF5848]